MGNQVSLSLRDLNPFSDKKKLDKEIINSITTSLKDVKHFWDEIEVEENLYFNNYLKWKESRRCTISALQKCQDELDTIHIYSSTGRAVGNGAAVLGGLATIVGIGLSFSKEWKPIADEMIKYGSAVGTIGGVTSVAANVAGRGFSAKVLREVKFALEEDKRLTAELLPWLGRSIVLHELFQRVFNCGVTDDVSDIFTAANKISILSAEGGKALTGVTEYLSQAMDGNYSPTSLRSLNDENLKMILCKASFKVKMLLLSFCESKQVREAFGAIFTSFRKHPDLFELCKLTSRITSTLGGQENILRSVVSMTGGVPSITLTQGVLQGISVVGNVLSFLSAVKDIKEGKSKYFKIIEETVYCLQLELLTLESKKFDRNLLTSKRVLPLKR